MVLWEKGTKSGGGFSGRQGREYPKQGRILVKTKPCGRYFDQKQKKNKHGETIFVGHKKGSSTKTVVLVFQGGKQHFFFWGLLFEH